MSTSWDDLFDADVLNVEVKAVGRRARGAARSGLGKLGRLGGAAGDFDESLHPRDSRGRFIEKGSTVRLRGGGTGEVIGRGTGDMITVQRTDNGRTYNYDKGSLTVTKRPGGGAPTNNEADAPADLVEDPTNDLIGGVGEQLDQAQGSRTASARPVQPVQAVTLPRGTRAAPDADPEGADTVLVSPDGRSQAWLRTDEGSNPAGYLRQDVSDPRTTVRYDSAEQWAADVDRRGMAEAPSPTPGAPERPALPPATTPDTPDAPDAPDAPEAPDATVPQRETIRLTPENPTATIPVANEGRVTNTPDAPGAPGAPDAPDADPAASERRSRTDDAWQQALNDLSADTPSAPDSSTTRDAPQAPSGPANPGAPQQSLRDTEKSLTRSMSAAARDHGAKVRVKGVDAANNRIGYKLKVKRGQTRQAAGAMIDGLKARGFTELPDDGQGGVLMESADGTVYRFRFSTPAGKPIRPAQARRAPANGGRGRATGGAGRRTRPAGADGADGGDEEELDVDVDVLPGYLVERERRNPDGSVTSEREERVFLPDGTTAERNSPEARAAAAQQTRGGVTNREAGDLLAQDIEQRRQDADAREAERNARRQVGAQQTTPEQARQRAEARTTPATDDELYAAAERAQDYKRDRRTGRITVVHDDGTPIGEVVFRRQGKGGFFARRLDGTWGSRIYRNESLAVGQLILDHERSRPAPDAPGTAGAANAPDAPNAPDVPSTPDAPDAGVAPDAPEMVDTPIAPDAPAAPAVDPEELRQAQAQAEELYREASKYGMTPERAVSLRTELDDVEQTLIDGRIPNGDRPRRRIDQAREALDGHDRRHRQEAERAAAAPEPESAASAPDAPDGPQVRDAAEDVDVPEDDDEDDVTPPAPTIIDYQTLTDDELADALGAANDDAEIDAITAEFDRRDAADAEELPVTPDTPDRPEVPEAADEPPAGRDYAAMSDDELADALGLTDDPTELDAITAEFDRRDAADTPNTPEVAEEPQPADQVLLPADEVARTLQELSATPDTALETGLAEQERLDAEQPNPEADLDVAQAEQQAARLAEAAAAAPKFRQYGDRRYVTQDDAGDVTFTPLDLDQVDPSTSGSIGDGIALAVRAKQNRTIPGLAEIAVRNRLRALANPEPEFGGGPLSSRKHVSVDLLLDELKRAGIGDNDPAMVVARSFHAGLDPDGFEDQEERGNALLPNDEWAEKRVASLIEAGKLRGIEATEEFPEAWQQAVERYRARHGDPDVPNTPDAPEAAGADNTPDTSDAPDDPEATDGGLFGTAPTPTPRPAPAPAPARSPRRPRNAGLNRQTALQGGDLPFTPDEDANQDDLFDAVRDAEAEVPEATDTPIATVAPSGPAPEEVANRRAQQDAEIADYRARQLVRDRNRFQRDRSGGSSLTAEQLDGLLVDPDATDEDRDRARADLVQMTRSRIDRVADADLPEALNRVEASSMSPGEKEAARTLIAERLAAAPDPADGPGAVATPDTIDTPDTPDTPRVPQERRQEGAYSTHVLTDQQRDQVADAVTDIPTSPGEVSIRTGVTQEQAREILDEFSDAGFTVRTPDGRYVTIDDAMANAPDLPVEDVNVDDAAAEAIPRNAPEQLPGENYPPTPQQQAVIDAVLAGKNTKVQAKAGSGKTSTLEALARRLQVREPDQQVAYIAFNKSVQVEADKRMPGNVEPRTGHSIAYQWASKDIQNRTRDKAPLRRPDDVAAHLGIRKTIKTGNGPDVSPTEQAMAAMRTVDTWANSDADAIGKEHLPESIKHLPAAAQNAVLDQAQAAWVDLKAKDGKLRLSLDHVRKMWALSRPDLTGNGSGLKKPATVLFLDEAQDTPPVLAKVVADQKMRKVIVGDADQAIYGFTGATDYLSTAEGDVELPLTKSWRFGPEVADIGNRFLQMLGSKGRVEGAGGPSKVTNDMAEPDAILVRSNGGMIGEILREQDAGRLVGVPKGTKQDLQSLVESSRYLMGYGRAPSRMHDDLAPFRDWDELRGEAERGDDPKLAMLVRIVDNNGLESLDNLVRSVVEVGGDDGLPGVTFTDMPHGRVAGGNTFAAKDSLRAAGFRWMAVPGAGNDKKGQPKKAWTAEGTPEQRDAKVEAASNKAGQKPDVMVSTAHKAKGLEWDRVRIGEDFRGPKVDDAGNIDMPDPEEFRLAYVAITRAQKEIDPGSLSYVYDYTDYNGGQAGDAPRVPDTIDDVERPNTPEVPSTPEVPDARIVTDDDVTTVADMRRRGRSLDDMAVATGLTNTQVIEALDQADENGRRKNEADSAAEAARLAAGTPVAVQDLQPGDVVADGVGRERVVDHVTNGRFTTLYLRNEDGAIEAIPSLARSQERIVLRREGESSTDPVLPDSPPAVGAAQRADDAAMDWARGVAGGAPIDQNQPPRSVLNRLQAQGRIQLDIGPVQITSVAGRQRTVQGVRGVTVTDTPNAPDAPSAPDFGTQARRSLNQVPADELQVGDVVLRGTRERAVTSVERRGRFEVAVGFEGQDGVTLLTAGPNGNRLPVVRRDGEQGGATEQAEAAASRRADELVEGDTILVTDVGGQFRATVVKPYGAGNGSMRRQQGMTYRFEEGPSAGNQGTYDRGPAALFQRVSPLPEIPGQLDAVDEAGTEQVGPSTIRSAVPDERVGGPSDVTGKPSRRPEGVAEGADAGIIPAGEELPQDVRVRTDPDNVRPGDLVRTYANTDRHELMGSHGITSDFADRTANSADSEWLRVVSVEKSTQQTRALGANPTGVQEEMTVWRFDFEGGRYGFETTQPSGAWVPAEAVVIRPSEAVSARVPTPTDLPAEVRKVKPNAMQVGQTVQFPDDEGRHVITAVEKNRTGGQYTITTRDEDGAEQTRQMGVNNRATLIEDEQAAADFEAAPRPVGKPIAMTPVLADEARYAAEVMETDGYEPGFTVNADGKLQVTDVGRALYALNGPREVQEANADPDSGNPGDERRKARAMEARLQKLMDKIQALDPEARQTPPTREEEQEQLDQRRAATAGGAPDAPNTPDTPDVPDVNAEPDPEEVPEPPSRDDVRAATAEAQRLTEAWREAVDKSGYDSPEANEIGEQMNAAAAELDRVTSNGVPPTPAKVQATIDALTANGWRVAPESRYRSDGEEFHVIEAMSPDGERLRVSYMGPNGRLKSTIFRDRDIRGVARLNELIVSNGRPGGPDGRPAPDRTPEQATAAVLDENYQAWTTSAVRAVGLARADGSAGMLQALDDFQRGADALDADRPEATRLLAAARGVDASGITADDPDLPEVQQMLVDERARAIGYLRGSLQNLTVLDGETDQTAALRVWRQWNDKPPARLHEDSVGIAGGLTEAVTPGFDQDADIRDREARIADARTRATAGQETADEQNVPWELTYDYLSEVNDSPEVAEQFDGYLRAGAETGDPREEARLRQWEQFRAARGFEAEQFRSAYDDESGEEARVEINRWMRDNGVPGLTHPDIRGDYLPPEKRSTATRAEVTAAYDLFVEEQYLRAEADTRGVMVNRAGVAKGISPRGLLSGPVDDVYRYASEELLEWFESNRRMQLSEFGFEMTGQAGFEKAARRQREANSRINRDRTNRRGR